MKAVFACRFCDVRRANDQELIDHVRYFHPLDYRNAERKLVESVRGYPPPSIGRRIWLWIVWLFTADDKDEW